MHNIKIEKRFSKSKKNFLYFLFCLLLTLVCFLCSCSFSAQKEDFRLSLSMNQTEIKTGGEIVAYAKFENLSSRTLLIVASSEADENLIHIYYYLKDTEPDISDVSLASETFLKKNASIANEVTLSDLQTGEYQIFPYVGFYQNNNFIGIKSNILNFSVL